MEGLTGYYTCKSQESATSSEVYTTLTNPLWRRTTPTVNYLPIGTLLPVISIQYADFSVGYQNLGSGFSYSLTFEPYTCQPDRGLALNQNISSDRDSLGPDCSNMITQLISGNTADLIGNNITYAIVGQLTDLDGQYQLNGKSTPLSELVYTIFEQMLL